MRSWSERTSTATATPPFKGRRLTVIRSRRETGSVPHIVLLGRLLTDAGFLPGCRMPVTVRRHRLVLQVVEPPDSAWRGKTDD
jgi:hypothetical protein